MLFIGIPFYRDSFDPLLIVFLGSSFLLCFAMRLSDYCLCFAAQLWMIHRWHLGTWRVLPSCVLLVMISCSMHLDQFLFVFCLAIFSFTAASRSPASGIMESGQLCLEVFFGIHSAASRVLGCHLFPLIISRFFAAAICILRLCIVFAYFSSFSAAAAIVEAMRLRSSA